MKHYYITTFDHETGDQLTCQYGYDQWLELITSFKKSGVDFDAYSSYF